MRMSKKELKPPALFGAKNKILFGPTGPGKAVRSPFYGQKGISLVEVILVIVLIGITIIPISRLSMQNLTQGTKYFVQTDAIADMQSMMEQIYADYLATLTGHSMTRGYDWVRANWNGSTGTTVSGKFNYAVSISNEQVQNGVTYVAVTVTITGEGIDPITNTTWLTK